MQAQLRICNGRNILLRMPVLWRAVPNNQRSNSSFQPASIHTRLLSVYVLPLHQLPVVCFSHLANTSQTVSPFACRHEEQTACGFPTEALLSICRAGFHAASIPCRHDVTAQRITDGSVIQNGRNTRPPLTLLCSSWCPKIRPSERQTVREIAGCLKTTHGKSLPPSWLQDLVS